MVAEDGAERAAKIMVLAGDVKRAEDRGREIREEIRAGLDELDRLASAREELERRIQGLIDGGSE